MRSHEIDYQVYGQELQFVEVELDPGETVIAEAGAMMYVEEGIHFEAKMGDGTEPKKGVFGKLASAGKRALTGETIFLTHFTNHADTKRRAAFSAAVPGRIMPIDLDEVGGEVILQRDAFLCAAMGTQVGIALNKKLGSGLFSEGFILQRLKGDGMVFINAGGMIVERELNAETLRLDVGCVVGFESGIEYSIERAGNLKTMMLGGEGLFLATLHGTGRVWIQSLPFSRLVNRIQAALPPAMPSDPM